MAGLKNFGIKYPTLKRWLLFFWNGSHNLYRKIQWKFERIRLTFFYSHHPEEMNPEVKQVLQYLKGNSFGVFNYKWCSEYDEFTPNVEYDNKADRYYVLHCGKKMYMQKGMTYAQVCHNYTSRVKEQDTRSPHCYSNFMKNNCYGMIIDGGGAEGMFALDYVEKADVVIIVEPDPQWVDALRLTFQSYQDKVVIIDKFLSRKESNSGITVDSIINMYGEKISEKKIVLKMDIEGYEEEALRGADAFLRTPNAEVITCTYHHQTAVEDIKKILAPYDFDFLYSNGYIYFPRMYEKQLFPQKRYSEMHTTLRRGVIGAFKKIV